MAFYKEVETSVEYSEAPIPFSLQFYRSTLLRVRDYCKKNNVSGLEIDRQIDEWLAFTLKILQKEKQGEKLCIEAGPIIEHIVILGVKDDSTRPVVIEDSVLDEIFYISPENAVQIKGLVKEKGYSEPQVINELIFQAINIRDMFESGVPLHWHMPAYYKEASIEDLC